jgi:hypothetical protein
VEAKRELSLENESKKIAERKAEIKGKNPWEAVASMIEGYQGQRDITRMKQVMLSRREDVIKKGLHFE